jgi:hypothetical protein
MGNAQALDNIASVLQKSHQCAEISTADNPLNLTNVLAAADDGPFIVKQYHDMSD